MDKKTDNFNISIVLSDINIETFWNVMFLKDRRFPLHKNTAALRSRFAFSVAVIRPPVVFAALTETQLAYSYKLCKNQKVQDTVAAV